MGQRFVAIGRGNLISRSDALKKYNNSKTWWPSCSYVGLHKNGRNLKKNGVEDKVVLVTNGCNLRVLFLSFVQLCRCFADRPQDSSAEGKLVGSGGCLAERQALWVQGLSPRLVQSACVGIIVLPCIIFMSLYNNIIMTLPTSSVLASWFQHSGKN